MQHPTQTGDTHTETSTHSRSWGQRHSESPVRTHRPSDKHRNPGRETYTYTQIQIPDSQINTHTNASTDTRQDDQIITRSGAWGQTDRPHRERYTDPQPESDGNTHTDMWRDGRDTRKGETEGQGSRWRREDGGEARCLNHSLTRLEGSPPLQGAQPRIPF